MNLLRSQLLGVCLALLHPLGAGAGALGVDSGMPVFVPPLVFPGDVTGSGVQGTSASGVTPAPVPPEEQAAAAAAAAKTAKPGAASESTTRAIVQGLQDSARFCASVPQLEYRLDCLSERLEAVAAAIPAGGDYADARAVLAQTAVDLGALVSANPSPDLPRARISQGGATPIATSRPLRPVATAALPDVAARADAILQEAETLLLRSSTGAASRTLAYQQIAAVVGSTKVLLRAT
jgi:hypothetical protein